MSSITSLLTKCFNILDIQYTIIEILWRDFKMLQYFQNLIWSQGSSESNLIKKKNHYKTTFTVPFVYYKWVEMPFKLENAHSKLHAIMNDIFNSQSKFIIVYIDDVLLFLKSITKRFNNLQKTRILRQPLYSRLIIFELINI
jgi:hypothetical protein